MSSLLELKNIALSYDFKNPTNNKGKLYRGTAHEFQDYAYRLACELNDLGNLAIYMKVTKTVQRNILQKAFEFVADSATKEKGKLFLWKIKQIRNEIEKENLIKSFDYQSIIKETAKLQNKIFKTLISKENEKDATNLLNQINSKISKSNKIQKALIIGSNNFFLLNILTNQNLKTTALNISKNITNFQKEGKQANLKIYTKDFLQKVFKEKFDLIIILNLWQFVPIDFEEKWLKKIFEITKENSTIFIEFKEKEEQIQKWDTFANNIYFQKFNSKIQIENKIKEKFKTKINFFTSGNENYLEFSKNEN